MKKNRVLGTFQLAMITVAAIVSLRNLPLSAEFGFASVFFLVVAALVFFIPIGLVTAELASTWPRAGGSYIWVSEAFGKPYGFFTLWVAWMESIAWFPAILAFTAAMVAHLLSPILPGLEDNRFFILATMLIVFWGATFSNFMGIQVSGWISSLGVILGTIIPGLLMIGLGIWWYVSGRPLQIQMNTANLIPNMDIENIVIFSGVLLGLAGVELAAFHITDAKHPQKSYPKALLLASVIILVIYILGTLSIAIVVPQHEIHLGSGLIQAFSVFFKQFHMNWMVPLLAFFLLLGSLAGINTWTIGPAKGLLVTAEDGFLSPKMKHINHHQVPTTLLTLQAIIGSILSLVFLYLDDSSASIWVLIALSAQFTFVQYFFVFAAVLKLRAKKPNLHRPFRTPCVGITSCVGMLACVFSFLIVFISPSQLKTGSETVYKLMILITFSLLILPPIYLSKKRQIKLRRKKNNLSFSLTER